MKPQPAEIFGGVDTHKHIHVAAAVDTAGRLLGAASFKANAAGYTRPAGVAANLRPCGSRRGGGHRLPAELAWLGTWPPKTLTPLRSTADRQMRRSRGKNDTVDAEAAARAAPRRTGHRHTQIRRRARGSDPGAVRGCAACAVKARTQAANQNRRSHRQRSRRPE